MSSIDKVTVNKAVSLINKDTKNKYSVFEQIFKQALFQGKGGSEPDNYVSKDNMDEIISNSQKVLFSGLGLAIPDENGSMKLDDGVLDTAVNKMQSALISSLKASMQTASGQESITNKEGGGKVVLSFVGASSASSLDHNSINSSEGGLLQQGALIGVESLAESVSPSNDESSIPEFIFGKDGAGTEDVIDSVNILNHIPIVSNIYQGIMATPEPSTVAKIVGASLFSGPIGMGIVTAELGINYFSDTKISELMPWSGLTTQVADNTKGIFDSVIETK